MVKKETCPVCKGNKVVATAPSVGASNWRTCNGCNGTGYQIRLVHGTGCSMRY